MQVKTFTGTSTKDIMARIKDELGPDAIILSNQKQVHKGVTCYEIMAALDMPPAPKSVTENIMPLGGDDATCLREEWTKLRKQLMAVLKPQMDIGLLTPRQQLVFVKYFVAMHPSSLRRTQKYASFLRIFAPCLWAFLPITRLIFFNSSIRFTCV